VPKLAESTRSGVKPTSCAGNERLGLRLSGSGGQGIILAATLLADAAARSHYQVVKTQSYGPEARGGASKAEVIIDTEPIDFPELDEPDVTLCLSQPAYEKYAQLTKPGGLLLIDSGLVRSDAEAGGLVCTGIPFTRLAETELGKKVAANIVALGALQVLCEFAPADKVAEAIAWRLPAKIVDLNLAAFELGRRHGEAARTQRA